MEIWRYIYFWKWRPQPLNTTSGFVFVDVTIFRRSKSISKPNFVEKSHLIGGWDIATFGFEIQTSAILEFYFRFRSWPFRRKRRVILHLTAEFRPNRSTCCGNMTSYIFLKMAAATAKYYFRFRICWCHCLQKVKVYQRTKFRQDSSIGGWDITTFGFEIQTSAILEFYFQFRSWPFSRKRRVILHLTAEFRPNRSTCCGNMTSYLFLKMAAATAKYYFRFRICWCHCLQTVKVYQQTKFHQDTFIRG